MTENTKAIQKELREFDGWDLGTKDQALVSAEEPNLPELRELLVEYIDGGCDHLVGICACGLISMLFDLDVEIGLAERCTHCEQSVIVCLDSRLSCFLPKYSRDM